MNLKHLPNLILSTAVALAASLFLCPKAAADTGIASVYDDWYHGKRTANGDTYNSYKYSAAGCGIPYGTRLKVTNTINGKSLTVKVNDTGGFCRSHPERILDLSRAAFEGLGGVYPGLLNIRTNR